MVISGAQVIVGAWLSSTVMICIQVASLPHASTAVHVLAMTPALPPQLAKLPALSSVKVIVIAPVSEQLSVAVALPPATLGSVD